MKKKVSIVLVASAMMLASCGLLSKPAPETSSSQDVPTTSETTSEKVEVNFKALAEKALAGVFTTYSTLASKGAAGDFELTVETSRMAEDDNKYTFTIKYTVDEAYASSIRISEDGKKAIVTTPNSLEGGKDIQAKIKAEIMLKDKTEVLAEDSFNVLVKAVAKMTLSYIYSEKDGALVVKSGDAVAFNAQYIGTYPKQGAIFADGENAIIAYTSYVPEGTKVGDYFNIAGNIKDYSGLRELDSGATLTKLDSNPGVADPVGITVDGENTPDIKFADGSRYAEIKNAIVTNVSVSSSGNATFTVKVGGKTYTAFNNAGYAADVFDSWKHVRTGETEPSMVKAGDKVTFNGFVSFYNNNPQVVYCDCTAWSEAKAAIEGASSVVVGAETKLTASALGGAEVAWTWSSSDETVATVDATGTVKGLKVGKTTITVTGTLNGEEISATVDFEVVELKLVEKTVDELLTMCKEGNTTDAIYDRANIYVVKGYLDGKLADDKYGNSVLVSPTTGKYIQFYGSTATDSAIRYDTTKGGWDFANPQDAVKTLADVHNGELVTAKVIFEDYKGTPEIMGVVTSHEASTAEHAVTVEAGENGTATTSVEKAAYGADVEVVATPAEGYVVDTVTVSGYSKNKTTTNTVKANADGKYIFKATTSNKVKVTFKTAPAPVDPDDPTGGSTEDTDTALIRMTPENFAKTAPAESGLYNQYNGDHTYGSYTVKTTAVAVNGNNNLQTLQCQKANAKIEIANIKVSKIEITVESKYVPSADYNLHPTFNGTETAFGQTQIDQSNASKKATVTDGVSYFTYSYELNASAAGSLVLSGNTGGAIYATEIAIF